MQCRFAAPINSMACRSFCWRMRCTVCGCFCRDKAWIGPCERPSCLPLRIDRLSGHDRRGRSRLAQAEGAVVGAVRSGGEVEVAAEGREVAGEGSGEVAADASAREVEGEAAVGRDGA